MNHVLWWALAAMLAVGAVGRSQAATCTTVVRSGNTDPNGLTFAKRFPHPPGINQGGDVVFVAKPTASNERLYRYPAIGAAEVVAALDGLAPNGGVYRGFRSPSINDAGDLVFAAKTSLGDGVFLRESGGAIESAAIATGSSPAGGAYSTFGPVSGVNSSAEVAFGATVNGGPSGIFRYDGIANTTSTVVLVGDAAGGGRSFCSFEDVALGDSSAVAFRALTQVNCADGAETPVEGIFYDGGSLQTVALVGDPSPIAGTTIIEFEDAIAVNGVGRVLFEAEIDGTLRANAMLLHDTTGSSTTSLVTTGEAAPTTGGIYGRFDGRQLDETNRALVKVGIQRGSARTAVFRFTPAAEALLLSSDPPPTDQFGGGAEYKKLMTLGMAHDGSRFALIAKVRDTVSPAGKIGVLRCTP